MPYYIERRRGERLDMAFETVEGTYAYVMAVADYGHEVGLDEWSLVRAAPGAADELVLPPGTLLAEAERWRAESEFRPGLQREEGPT